MARPTSRSSWRPSTSTRTSTSLAYGPDNHLRLTGLHETQSIDKFNYGVANRGASIRIPHRFVANDAYRGYLEDRRPNSQADPYKIIARLVQTFNRSRPPSSGGFGPRFETEKPSTFPVEGFFVRRSAVSGPEVPL